MSGSAPYAELRMCSLMLGRKETDNTVVTLETGAHDDPKAIRYSVVFYKGVVTEVKRKGKTSPSWRSVWGSWQKRPYGQLIGHIISEAQRMLAAQASGEAKS